MLCRVDVFAAKEFDAIPWKCLSLYCRRFKSLCGPSSYRTRGASIAESFFRSCYVNIDISERTHNLMRQDLGSGGQGRTPAVSANRVFLRMAEGAHLDNGGVAATARTVKANKPKKVGGNPLMEFKNSCKYSLGSNVRRSNLPILAVSIGPN